MRLWTWRQKRKGKITMMRESYTLDQSKIRDQIPKGRNQSKITGKHRSKRTATTAMLETAAGADLMPSSMVTLEGPQR